MGACPRQLFPPTEVQQAKEKVTWVRAGRGSDSYNQTDGKYQKVLSRGWLEPGAGYAAWGGDLLGGAGTVGQPGLYAHHALNPTDDHVLSLG